MYPLNLTLAEGVGYAVANDEAEHEALTDRGYVPAYAGPRGTPPDLLAPGVSGPDKPKRGRPRKVPE